MIPQEYERIASELRKASWPDKEPGMGTMDRVYLDDALSILRAHVKSVDVEAVSAVEHEQWAYWAKILLESEQISEERAVRWLDLMKPYEELTEQQKEHDRIWARKAIAAMNKQEG